MSPVTPISKRIEDEVFDCMRHPASGHEHV